MRNLFWIGPLLALSFSCKKPDPTKPVPVVKECKSGYFWDGSQCIFDTVKFAKDDWQNTWGSPFKELLDSMWHGKTNCPYADSAYICLRSFDSTKLPYRRDMAFRSSPYAEFGQSSLGSPITRQNYWPDAARGDSIILEMPSPFGAYDITFYGRFNPAQDTLRGRLYYTTIGNVPDLPECGPMVFTRVKVIR